MTEQELTERAKELIKARRTRPIELPLDENGVPYVDKEKYPEIYDWVVNG
jgi:hypothetical protein